MMTNYQLSNSVTPVDVVIIAGGGDLPSILQNKLAVTGVSSMTLGVKGHVADKTKCDYIYDFGQATTILSVVKAHQPRYMVLLGPVLRPNLKDIITDPLFYRIFGHSLKGLWSGDDGVLRAVTQYLEKEVNTKIVGIDHFMPELLLSEGNITSVSADEKQLADIDFGRLALDALSPYDVGQGLVMVERRIYGVEAVEGTDELLRRCSNLARHKSSYHSQPQLRPILIKQAKIGQDLRLDLPTIGVKTAQLLVDLGYAGMALRAGSCLCPELAKVIAIMDRGGLFIHIAKAAPAPK